MTYTGTNSIGFECAASDDATVLILGTLPSEESLRSREYYANQRNQFWQIMGRLVGAAPEQPYKNRLHVLMKRRIALWDVCASAERSGSLDSKIVLRSIVPNNFEVFLGEHTHINLICFNGNSAANLFRRKVQTGNESRLLSIRSEVLPSTSPAYAAMHIEDKLSRWRKVLSEFIDFS